MAALTGNSIDSSYQGLIKTTDNGAISGTAKAVTDGLGNATNIEISNTATNFVSGTVDFTGSTVTGLPSGAAGLENGSGADSLQSAAALTTNAANAAGSGSIALGDGASATRQESVAIGQGALANGGGSEGSIAIGHGSVASSNRGIAIGINGTTNSSEGIVIGDDVDISGSDRSVAIGGAITISGGSDKVAIGTSAAVGGTRGIAFGQNATADGANAIAMGYNSSVAGQDSVGIGLGATAQGSNAIAIGKGAETGASSNEVIVIGNSQGGTAASESIRIGHDIPGSSFNSNNVAIGNNFDSVSGNGNVMVGNSASSASDYNTLVGYNTTALFQNGVAIGRDATAGNQAAIIAIGQSATGGAFAGAIAIGRNTQANANAAVALGDGVIAATADTVSVKALETQTDSTPTAGGIIMSDAGGTDRRLNIDALGRLQIDSTPVGGGGGSVSHPARYFGSGNLTTTFEGPYTFFSNDILFYAVHLQQGEEVTELAVELGAAFTNTTSIGMALYDSQIGTATVEYVPNNKLLDLGTANPSTIGVKTFTGSTYTATYTGTYFIALGYNGQWDGTFRQTESNIRSYQADTYFIANTTLGFARDVNIFEPIRYAGSYNDSMPASFTASQSFSNTSARLALMGKTAQNI